MDNQERFNIHAGELKSIEVLLPLETVVSLKDKVEKVIILKHNVINEFGEKYDYLGNFLINEEIVNFNSILFNKDQIAKIYSLGSSNSKYKVK